MAKKSFTALLLLILIFSFSVPAEDISTLLEEGIYTEETKGNLDEAMAIYKKIIDENMGNSANIAEAYYRLGKCYLKRGDDKKAIEMFNELLTDFRDHEGFASDARGQLLKLNALDEEDRDNKYLKTVPAPWEIGETCRYDIKIFTGTVAGELISVMKEADAGDSNLWRIDHYIGIPIENSQVYTRTDVMKDSFIPVTRISKGIRASIRLDNKINYEKDHISIDFDMMDSIGKKEIPVSYPVYAYDEIPSLVRILPLKEGYRASFTLFDSERGILIDADLVTKKKETVTVPAGTFECYYIELELEGSNNQKLWVSIDEKRYLVKQESQYTMELKKITKAGASDTVAFHDDETGVSMSAPNGWYFIKSPINAQYKIMLFVIPPELEPDLQVMFVSNPHGGVITKETFRNIMEMDANVVKQAFKNYSIITESWEPGSIDGLDSLSYYADYDEKDKKMVEYRYYLIDSTSFYAFIIRLEKTVFKNNKPELDALISSFRAKKK